MVLDGFFEHGAGDYLGAREVDDFAVILEEVEGALPVVAHNEGIDVVAFDVGDFLFPVLFRDHQIYVADSLNDFFSLGVGHDGFFVFDAVEFIGGEGYDEVIAEFAGTHEKVHVAVVEEVEGAVGYYFFHDYPL